MEPEIRRHPGGDTPRDLAHAYAAVGPGWWPLVRGAFADAAGGAIERVRQKHGWLDVAVRHPAGRHAGQEVRERYRALSQRVCEACGGPAVPTVERIPRPTRTHCETCEERWDELLGDERALWIDRAGCWLPEWRR